MAPIKSTQSRTGGKLIRGGRSTDVTSDIDGVGTEISGRREDNLSTLLAVSGGTKIESGNDRYHVFTSPGTFTTGVQLTAEVLVVASGGSGAGAAYGAGGGAGGVLHAPSTTLEKGRYAVAVGGQGVDGGWYNAGSDGDNSSFADAIAIGGGAGTGYLNGPAVRPGSPLNGTITRRGRAGGSCGGSGVAQNDNPVSPDAVTPQPAPSDYTPYGNVGGNGGGGAPTGFAAGGGGGAGAVGSNAGGPASAVGGNGGAGRAFPSFPAPVIAPGIPAPVRPGWTPVVGPTGLFAGGGGGSHYYQVGGAAPSGGTGGGGDGAPGSPETGAAGDATRFTGSGGGGGNYPSYPLTSHGGKGGDGIVIVKYSVS